LQCLTAGVVEQLETFSIIEVKKVKIMRKMKKNAVINQSVENVILCKLLASFHFLAAANLSCFRASSL
jgi:hypothetical protein